MNQERLMKIILAPVISEKATLVGEMHRQVAARQVAGAEQQDNGAMPVAARGIKQVRVDAAARVPVRVLLADWRGGHQAERIEGC